MIPGWWQAVVLGLAAYRVARLVGWDDLPPVEKARAWVTGETVQYVGDVNSMQGVSTDKPTTSYVFRRPVLAHFLHCAFCTGFWIALAEYLAWTWEPSWTLRVMFPWALAAVPGLVARNLDR